MDFLFGRYGLSVWLKKTPFGQNGFGRYGLWRNRYRLFLKQCSSKRLLKLFSDSAVTTSSGKPCQSSTTLWLKKRCLHVFLKPGLYNLMLFPLRLVYVAFLNKRDASTFSLSVSILCLSIMTPLFLLYRRVYRPSLCNLKMLQLIYHLCCSSLYLLEA